MLENYVTLVCHGKECILPPNILQLETPKLPSLCTTSQLFQCLVNGGQGILLLLSSILGSKIDISIILVVNEFKDVFPYDVTFFPSRRKIEFSINLAPRSDPISIAYYMMSPLELSELKNHLEDLINK